jgi:hypothetical protein
MYGPLDDAANMLDEIGTGANVGELTSAVCNVMRAAAAQLRMIDKLAERFGELEARVAELEPPKFNALRAELDDALAAQAEAHQLDEDQPDAPCTNAGGHEWAYENDDEVHGRCLCVYCGADGDA